MRRIPAVIPALALAAAIFGLTASLGAQTPPPAPKETPVTPRKAGEFAINMTDGSQKLLSSYRGKVVVMAFMFTTCSHCQHTAGLLSTIQNEYAAKGVQMLGITIDPDSKQGIPAFLKITGANFPVGFSSSDLAMKFLHMPNEGWYVPMLAFIDQTGTLRSQYVVTDPGDAATKFLDNQDVNIRKEIDKFLKPAAHTAAGTAGSSTHTGATKQSPKS
jgi:peroxiredoxin